MKFVLECPIKECSFHTDLDYDASEAKCVEVANRFKRHLLSHSVNQLTDTIYDLLLHLKGAK